MKKLIGLLVIIMVFISCESEELESHWEVISIYNWDLTENNIRTIENPIDVNRIDSYRVVLYMDFDEPDCEGVVVDGINGSVIIEGDKIIIEVGKAFNSSKYNDNKQKRGYITIKYV